MTRKFLTDKEIDLNNGDFLKTKVYADNLAKIIRSTEENKVFTIGLYGSWGSGKSSIIETAKSEFNDTEKVKFITYDAWQYSNDSFRRMFLRCLREHLNFDEATFMKKFYENETMDVDNKFKLSSDRASIMLFSILVVIIILWAIPMDFEFKTPIYSIITILGLLFTLFTGAFHQLKIAVTKPYFFAPEQFEECFNEMVSKSLKTNTTIENLKYVLINDKTVRDLKKLVIVIDNIDRCHSDIAYQLLTDIKTFLGSQDLSIVFVIPVDDKALLKHFFLKNDNIDNNHRDKEEFLRKIFNVTLRIKPYNETDMFSFTKAINDKNELGFKNETINIIGKEYSSNPRRVIQLMNNLISELNNYKQRFSKENETLICCVLIIREEYPEFYEMTIKNASLLLNDGNAIDNINIENKDTKEEIKRFMRIAGAEFKNCNVSILTKVLMNTDNLFADIPPEVSEMINTFDSEKLLKYIAENQTFNHDTYKYLGHKIDESSKNGLIKDLAQYLELAAVLNKISPIPTEYAFRIYEVFNDKMESVFFNCINPDVLLSLIEYEDSHLKRYTLKKLIIDSVKSNLNTTDETSKIKWIQILDSLIENFKDKETCIKLSKHYTTFYLQLTDFINFDKTQFNYLITEEFIKGRIMVFNFNDIEEVEYKKIKILFEKISNKTFFLDCFFGVLYKEQNEFSNLNEKLKLINLLQDFFELMLNNKLDYEKLPLKNLIINIFANDIFEDEKFLNSKIIKELSTDNTALLKLLDFITSFYKVSNDIDLICNYFFQLSKHIRKEVKQRMIDFKNEGLDIIKLYSVVKLDYDYSDPNTLELLKYYLTYNKDDYQIINNEENGLKISDLIEDINGVYSKDINSLLIFLSNDNQYYSEIIGKKIFYAKKPEILSHISPEIKKLVVKYFEVDDEMNYINEIFMEFVFDYGDEKLKEFYVNLIKLNLGEFKKIIEILDTCINVFSIKNDGDLKNKILENIRLFKEKHSSKPNTPVNKKINEKLKTLIQ
jgi:hypothetical protein